MYPDVQLRNKKITTSLVVIVAVVIIAVTVNAWSHKTKTASTTATNPPTNSSVDSGTSTAPAANTNASTTYKDGTYSASESYPTPGGTEDITVHLTVKSDAITNATIDQNPTNNESAEYQDRFNMGYASYVVGKPLNSINLSRVSGASLTTEGFDAALEQIKNQAQKA